MMDRAVFLDRDGVINYPVLDSKTNNYRAPWCISEFKMIPGVIESLKLLQKNGYVLFLVTNQPDYTKGNTSIKSLLDIRKHLIEILSKNNINFRKHYYCFHQENDNCVCRKPNPTYLSLARIIHNINLEESWMIGDRDTDIEFGQNGGTKTILIENKFEIEHIGKSNPNHKVNDLKEATKIIIKE